MPLLNNMSQSTLGFLAAFTAFSTWGSLVLYWKALENVPAEYVLSCRMIFSMLASLPFVYWAHSWHEVRAAFTDKKLLLRMFLTALVLAANWLIYIWAVNHERVIEASLGYFVTPLLSVLLGRIFLGEKMTRLQIFAICIAAFGVIWSIIAYGQFPFVGLFLALSFSSYGYLRKTVKLCATSGFFMETVLLFPLASAWLIWQQSYENISFSSFDTTTQILLLSSGFITSIPLLLFAYASKRIQLATLGLLQYITPTCTLFVGIFLFNEPVMPATKVTLSCIWVALALYTWCGIRHKPPLEQTKNI